MTCENELLSLAIENNAYQIMMRINYLALLQSGRQSLADRRIFLLAVSSSKSHKLCTSFMFNYIVAKNRIYHVRRQCYCTATVLSEASRPSTPITGLLRTFIEKYYYVIMLEGSPSHIKLLGAKN